MAAHWARALGRLGFQVRTVAGSGVADVVVPGLAWGAEAPPSRADLARALLDVDLVVVENLCSLPLQPAATDVLVRVLHGRPAILHHYDLPWERERFAHVDGWPPVDPSWRHVAVSDLSVRRLAERGIPAVRIYNAFDTDERRGDRDATRRALGIADDERLVLHPVRAIARKDVPAAVALAGALGATYWLTGPAEEGYGPTLEAVLDAAPGKVVHRPAPGMMRDAYAAADLVAFPSRWEGFGNPLVESAVHRRPLVVGDYPVAREIAALGFRWFGLDEVDRLRRWLDEPDRAVLDGNHEIARRHFSLASLVAALGERLEEWGWTSS